MQPRTLSNTLFEVLASNWPDVCGDKFNIDMYIHFDLNNDFHANNLQARFPTRLGGLIDTPTWRTLGAYDLEGY
jgi:hypothetical protein